MKHPVVLWRKYSSVARNRWHAPISMWSEERSNMISISQATLVRRSWNTVILSKQMLFWQFQKSTPNSEMTERIKRFSHHVHFINALTGHWHSPPLGEFNQQQAKIPPSSANINSTGNSGARAHFFLYQSKITHIMWNDYLTCNSYNPSALDSNVSQLLVSNFCSQRMSSFALNTLPNKKKNWIDLIFFYTSFF